ncbi:hypothetical protein AXG94_21340 [Pseudomonas corrugata]|nr:hypothetical protein AXG94_21340 [Pseudomonas corrugata]
MRFIRMMKRIKGIREKMWAGQTAPFFCLRIGNGLLGNASTDALRSTSLIDSSRRKAKRPARGLFEERR